MQQNILEFLTARPYISLLGLERAAGVPAGAIRRAMYGIENIPEKHIPAIVRELRRIGFDNFEQTGDKLNRI